MEYVCGEVYEQGGQSTEWSTAVYGFIFIFLSGFLANHNTNTTITSQLTEAQLIVGQAVEFELLILLIILIHVDGTME
jgi:hypothetical protein